MMHISNVSKLVHDKVTSSGSSSHLQGMKFNCEGVLNALAVNKDRSQVIVAGRTVFKILNIKEDGFSDRTNLLIGKLRKGNLTYSTADVIWHPSDESIIASGATNGSVLIWNLNMAGKFKQDKTLEKHDRSVTRVLFHHTEHHQLLSASQDGVVMIHDIRKEKHSMQFGRAGNDSVRDAQFCPSSINSYTFAAAYENGSVQTWDMRMPDKYERQFMAHNGPVFSLDWHPADKTWWLATAGRDKTIKVWDMVRLSSSPQPPCLYSIGNIAPVARIKWRPNRKTHISSCSMVVDNCVNVWDVNRPFIPFAAFDGHTDMATSIVWHEDCQSFLSCGKDGYIIQHVFRDARRPADHVNMSGIDLNARGDIGYAFCDKNEKSTSSLGRSKKLSRSRQFTQANNSGLCVFEACPNRYDETSEEDDNDLQYFAEIARCYRLEGVSLVDMCWENGEVAEQYGKIQIAQFWRMLAVMCTSYMSSQPGVNLNSSTRGALSNNRKEIHDAADMGSKPTMTRPKDMDKRKSTNCSVLQTDTQSGSTDESSDYEGESSEVERSGSNTKPHINFWFGDDEGGDEDPEGYDYNGPVDMMDGNGFDWTMNRLPNEGFQPRHELVAMTGDQRHMADATMDVFDSLRHGGEITHITSQAPVVPSTQGNEVTLTVKPQAPSEQQDCHSVIADMICSLAYQGDVQSAVSMLIVLGDSIRPQIDEIFQECWFLSYIDLLSRFELWTVCTTVIKQSKLLGVCCLNQVSTSYHTQCSSCSRQCERAPWLCDKCKLMTNICSLCHQPVRGLMSWCQGCGHGGHLEHIQGWMNISAQCPAGCGHLCEYS